MGMLPFFSFWRCDFFFFLLLDVSISPFCYFLASRFPLVSTFWRNNFPLLSTLRRRDVTCFYSQASRFSLFSSFWRRDFLASRFPLFLISGVAISLVSTPWRRDFHFFHLSGVAIL